MEKPNFQRETEKAIERLCVVSRPPLLLHACCAPCSSYVLEYLTQYFSITLFFCNPNITDPAEYQKRLAELRRFCAEAPFCRDVTVVEDSLMAGLLLSCRACAPAAGPGYCACDRLRSTGGCTSGTGQISSGRIPHRRIPSRCPRTWHSGRHAG